MVSKKERKKDKKLVARRKSAESFTQIMNGEFLTRGFVVNNLNFILFCVGLMILVVSKGYYVTQLSKKIRTEEKAIRNLNTDFISERSQLEEMTRRGELVKRLSKEGLRETINPVKVIRVKEKEETE